MTVRVSAPSGIAAAVPEDAAERDRIRDDLDTTLFVQAAAGSGKTSALVARVTALVDRGRCELREIAAISFTEAAAGELRSRVAESLMRPVPDEVDASVTARRAAALHQLDEAAMTTIHGFAQRLLAEHPIEAGLPLRFDIADEHVALVAREQRYDAFVDRLFDEERSADLLRAATALGVRVEQLRPLAEQMGERFDRLSGVVDRDEPISELVIDGVNRVRDAAIGALEYIRHCSRASDRLFGRLVRLEDALGGVSGTDGWFDALSWLVSLPKEAKGKVGSRNSWVGPGVEAPRAALRAYDDERHATLAAVRDRVLGGLGLRLLDEARSFASDRRSVGSLFFHDLLVLARDLLAGHPAVRAEVRDRYRFILIDEFQDTDPLQYEILCLLGSGDATSAFEPGRLFFVGDPMQSIYRFRGADVGLYRAAREAIGEGSVVRLSTNFRSSPVICDFVSDAFSRLVDGPDAESVRLRAFRPDSPVDRVWGIGGGDRELSAAERRTVEALEIVEVISGLVASEAPVRDGEGHRPVRYGDVAVLVPVRTGLEELLGAFDRAGIDVRLTESSLIYDSEQVREVIAVLRAVEERGDDREVIAALRTSLLGCTDGDLRSHAEAGGSWDLGLDDVRGRAGGSAVLGALANLREMRDARGLLGPVDTLRTVITRTGAREIAATSRRGDEALRRLDFLLERARAFRDGGGRTLADLLRFFAIEARVGIRSESRIATDAAEDAVRVLTIHGAKGLEFPVVVLAELGGAIGSKPKTPALLIEDGRLAIGLGGENATLEYDELAAASAAASREESIRLAYVAATRAREYLVISTHHKPTNDGGSSLAALIAEVADLSPAPPLGGGTAPRRSGPRDERDEITPERLGEYVARWQSVNAWAALPEAVTPSALEGDLPARRGPEPRSTDESGEDGEDGGVGWRRARASSGIGRAVHAVLQRLDLRDPDGLGLLAARYAKIEGCEEFVEVVGSLALAATRAPVVAEAFASSELHRELPLTLTFGDGFVEGVVDLCFEREDGLVIVDYKTDVVVDVDEALERAERYRLQAGAYALALRAITARPVARVVLLFLAPPDGSIEVDVRDLDGAMAEASGAIGVALAREETPLSHDRSR